MAGFSSSIKQLTTPGKWATTEKKSAKRKSQVGSGKISKKRHSVIDVEKCKRDTYSTLVYPYCFIDQTQRAQLSKYRLYVDILGDFKIAYCSAGMKGYILAEKDFLAAYRILADKKLFVLATLKNGLDKGQDKSRDKRASIPESSERSAEIDDSETFPVRESEENRKKSTKSSKSRKSNKRKRRFEADLQQY